MKNFALAGLAVCAIAAHVLLLPPHRRSMATHALLTARATKQAFEWAGAKDKRHFGLWWKQQLIHLRAASHSLRETRGPKPRHAVRHC